MEFESVNGGGIPIAKTTASDIDRVISRDIEKSILGICHTSLELRAISHLESLE